MDRAEFHQLAMLTDDLRQQQPSAAAEIEQWLRKAAEEMGHKLAAIDTGSSRLYGYFSTPSLVALPAMDSPEMPAPGYDAQTRPVRRPE